MKYITTHVHRTIGLIFLLALVLRLLVFAYIGHEPRKFYHYDSDGYDRRAMNILRYGVFASQAQPPLTPDLDRTPAYPALLAGVFGVVGHRPGVVILLQIVLGSLTAVLAYLLARELQLSQTIGVGAALLVAVEPISLLTTNRLLTETVFTTLLVAGIWSLARYWRTQHLRWIVLSAGLIALTSLTRPISQFLPLALLPLFALALPRARWRAGMGAALLFVVLSTALTYTWAIRNYRETGIFTLSTIADTNLIYYRARAVLAAGEGISQDEAWRQLEAQIDRTATEQQLTPAEKIGLQRQEALAIFRRYPTLTLTMMAKGAARIVADPGYTLSCTLLNRQSTLFECIEGRSTMNDPNLIQKALGKFGQMSLVQQFTVIWGTVMLGITYLASAIGLVGLRRERRWLALALLVLVIVYFIGLSVGAEANSRFRIPAVPFLAILAGSGLESMLRYRQLAAVGARDRSALSMKRI